MGKNKFWFWFIIVCAPLAFSAGIVLPLVLDHVRSKHEEELSTATAVATAEAMSYYSKKSAENMEALVKEIGSWGTTNPDKKLYLGQNDNGHLRNHQSGHKTLSGTKRQWSSQEKLTIVLQGLKDERNINMLCKKHGITKVMYCKWRDQLLVNAAKLFDYEGTDYSREQLVQENRRLKEIIGELTVELKKHHISKGNN